MQVENEEDHHLIIYKQFFDNFVKEMDQLPVKVAGYQILETELIGEIVDWTYQYLQQKDCPPTLFVPLCRQVIDEMLTACKKHPLSFGNRENKHVFPPLKLMQAVTSKIDEICSRYLDPNRLSSLPKIQRSMAWSSAIKNSRRLMEDRHVIIEDFHGLFDLHDRSPASFYAVFDGHAGTDAATYANNHLHQFLAESSFYPSDPKAALQDAFQKTDELFLNKSNIENLRSGTTALCALLRRKDQMIYVAWSGDSQAILIRREEILRLVNPHKPDRKDEKDRITNMGGCVLYWGTWRVNGQLAVSRAIGDTDYKPYVTAEPDILSLPLDGSEHFLVLACDGLWDFVNEQDVTKALYEELIAYPDDLSLLSSCLVKLSKSQGSTDNITVIVALLADPEIIIQSYKSRLDSQDSNFVVNDSWSATGNETFTENSESVLLETQKMDASTSAAANNNPFLKSGLMMESSLFNAQQNGTSPTPTATAASELFFLNGKQSIGGDIDFGPETDVDATDEPAATNQDNDNDVMTSNILLPNKQQQLLDDLKADLELQRQQMSDFDPILTPRDETPTPPADEVPKPALCGLSEPDNVAAESGDDSEDEWNYFRVEQKPGQSTATTTTTIDTVLEKTSTEPNIEKIEDNLTGSSPVPPQAAERPNFLPEDLSKKEQEELDDMASQLNPNAAEFIPSPTHGRATIEQLLLLNGSGSSNLDESDVSSTRAEFGDTSQASVGQFFGNLDPLETFEQPRIEHAELVNLGPVDVVSPLGSIPEAGAQQQIFEDDETLTRSSEFVASNLMEPLSLTTTRQEFESSSMDLLSPSSMEPKSPLPELVQLMDNSSDLNIRPSESPQPTINENSLHLIDDNDKLVKSPSPAPILQICPQRFSPDIQNQMIESSFPENDSANIERPKTPISALEEKSPIPALSPPKSPVIQESLISPVEETAILRVGEESPISPVGKSVEDLPILISPLSNTDDSQAEEILIQSTVEKDYDSPPVPILHELESNTSPDLLVEPPLPFPSDNQLTAGELLSPKQENDLISKSPFDEPLSPKIEFDNDLMMKSTFFEGPILNDLQIGSESTQIEPKSPLAKSPMLVEAGTIRNETEPRDLCTTSIAKSPLPSDDRLSPVHQEERYSKSPIPDEIISLPVKSPVNLESKIGKISDFSEFNLPSDERLSPVDQETRYPKSPIPDEIISLPIKSPLNSPLEAKSPNLGDTPVSLPIYSESISSPVPKMSSEAEIPVSSIPIDLPSSPVPIKAIPIEGSISPIPSDAEISSLSQAEEISRMIEPLTCSLPKDAQPPTEIVTSPISQIIEPVSCSLPKDVLPSTKVVTTPPIEELKEVKNEKLIEKTKAENIKTEKVEKEKKSAPVGIKKSTTGPGAKRPSTASTISKTSTTTTKAAPKTSTPKVGTTSTTKVLASKSAPTKSQPTSPTKPLTVKTTSTASTIANRKPITSTNRTSTTTTTRTSAIMNRSRTTASPKVSTTTTTTITKVSASKPTTRPLSATTKTTTTTTNKTTATRPSSATTTLKSRPSTTSTTATTKKPIANGDIKSTTAKPRPPISSRTTSTTTTTPPTSRPTKPKTETAKVKPILDKQGKETANKQLSTTRPRTSLNSTANTTKRLSIGGTTTTTTRTTKSSALANGKVVKKSTTTSTTEIRKTTTNPNSTSNGIDGLESISEQNGNKTEVVDVTIEPLDNAVHLIAN